MNLFNHLLSVSRYLSSYQLIKESCYAKSQFYVWLKDGVRERKVRECKPVSKEVVKRSIGVIWQYPHFSASKGQCYMIYHQLGYIPQHVYKGVKKIVKRLIFQEVSNRQLLPPRTSYMHVSTKIPGKIWAEDFTQVRVWGEKFYIELVIDVAISYYLGGTASRKADSKMVETPIEQALMLTGGKGPELFLLSDNGRQYIGPKHRDFLDKYQIVQKRIPSCQPQYNGSVECGIKEFKNVFYNIWAQREKSGVAKGETLLTRVQLAVNDTIRIMNEEIPRPVLSGVTPMDVWKSSAHYRMKINRQYVEKEQLKKEVINPWNRNDWGIIKEALFDREFSQLELLTKFCFFLKRPLRQVTKLVPKVLGN
jgi:transposase InsO family protein